MRQTTIQTAVGILFLLGPFGAIGASGGTWIGKVVGVRDGDTITVLRGKRPITIRLHGVECPKLGQPFGKRAQRFTSKLVFGKPVRVKPVAKDHEGRTVAKISYQGILHRNPLDRSRPHQVIHVQRSLQETLVQVGLAWWHRRHAPKDKKLARLEDAARTAKRGLWADNAPVAPWDWRPGTRNVSDRPRPQGTCAVDQDCAIGHLRAGDCGVAMPRTEAARIQRETERLCARGKGPREKCGPMPGCIPGRILRRAVCREGRCVGLTAPR